MAAELDALWNEFAAETEDHLNSLERLLSAQFAPWSGADVGALFRYFHSLKGTFLAMGFDNVEAVAHRCEDILSLVRDGKASLDPALVRTLLRAVDRLKDMRDDVLATQQDARPAADILAELAKHGASNVQNLAASPAPAQDLPLSDDPEMLGIYSELLEQRLALTADALSIAAAERAAAAETASELGYGAEMMRFESLAAHLNALAETTAREPEERGNIIGLFGEIREQVKIIEELTGQRSGAAALASALAERLKPDYPAALDRLDTAADHDAAGILAAAQNVRAMAACQGLEQAASLLVLLEEETRGKPDPAGREAISGRVHETTELLRANFETGDVPAGDVEACAARWMAGFRATPLEREHALASLSPALTANLSPEQVAKLEKAGADGHMIFELLLDLESHPDVAGDVLAWLSTAVQAITSQTAHQRGAGCFDFLITSEHPLDWVRAQLAALDPERMCLRDVKALGDAPVATGAAPVSQAGPSRTPLIRVPSETVDDLMAEVGEMRSALAMLADILHNGGLAKTVRGSRRRTAQTIDEADWRQARDAIDADLRDLRSLHHTLESAHRRIWGVGLQLRVIPVDGLFGRLARAARDLAEKLGKDIDVVIDGREVRIDKSMVDVLIDPLMHMVRNAVDHGIETPAARAQAGKSPRATLTIAASENGNRIDVTIGDDGAGLDRDRIAAKAVRLAMMSEADAEHMSDADLHALIFRPGFSTAGTVTEISGRGVGLDVVETTIQRLGGTIDVQSAPGRGTRFLLRLPISAALLRALLVEAGGQIYAFPERQVVAVRELDANGIEQVAGQSFILHRDAAIPLRPLASALGFATRAETTASHVIIVSAGTRVLALSVERVLRFQDLFLKELHPVLAAIPTIAGTSVLGDGRPVLVLDAGPLASVEITGAASP